MEMFPVTVQQISFPSDEIVEDSSSLDSFSSVVDPNVDFMVKNEGCVQKGSLVDLSHFTDDSNSISGSVEHNPEESPSSLCNPESKQEEIYPTISLAVAQCMNENDPKLLREAERYLNMESDDLSRTPVSTPIASNAATSLPLHSLSVASEALALQQSVIGNSNITPVSSDIVAQVVANTKKLLLQGNSSQVPFMSSLPSNGSESNLQNPTLNSSSNIELIQYPAKSISSTVEKRSWFTNSSYETNSQYPSNLASEESRENDLCSRSNSVASISPFVLRKSSSSLVKSGMAKVHASKSTKSPQNSSSGSLYEIYPDSSAEYETESSVSEKYEAESLFSEGFETESNLSEVSGIDDEMFLAKKQKGAMGFADEKVVHNGTQVQVATSHAMTSPAKYFMPTSDKSVETDESYNFQLLREKAHLEGKLESVSHDQANLMKERDQFRSQAVSLEAQIKSLQKQLDGVALEKNRALKALDSVDLDHKNWDSVIKEYQSIIESKNNEIKGLKEDLSEAEQANVHSRISYEELKVDVDAREGAVSGLKKKVAELQVELQVMLQGKIQLENELKNVRLEMEMLQKSREWFQEQLHSTQDNRNKLHQELIFLQNNQSAISNNLERVASEKNQLRQELVQTQERAVAEKEVLMKHLETIEADMKERETLFDDIQKDKGTAEVALAERIRKLEEEKLQSSSLSLTLSDLEYQLKMLKSDIEEKDKMLQTLKQEKASLSRQNAVLQKSLNDKVIVAEQLSQEIKDLNAKIRQQEMSASRSEELLSILKNERTAIEIALAAANEEKRIVDESLKSVSDTLNKFQHNFKLMKADLIAKTSQAEQLKKEKLDFQESLMKAEEALLNLRKEFDQQVKFENHNKNVLLDDLKKKKNDVENVLSVCSKDLLNYQQAVETLSNEKNELNNEVKALKNLLESSKRNIVSLTDENISLKKHVSEMEDLSKTSNNKQYKALVEENISPKEIQKTQIFERARKAMHKKLKEKMKECDDLKAQLNEQREKSEVVANVSCDSCPAHVELLGCQKKIQELEAELSDLQRSREEQAILLKKNEELIIELEREKGKATGFVDKYETLRLHLTEMEVKLGERDSQIVQLSSEAKSLRDKLSDLDASSKSQIANLEVSLNKERALVENLRQQVFQEKRANSHLQREISNMKNALQQANQVADSKKQEVESLQAELSLKMQAELKHRAEVELFQTEIRLQKSIAEKLSKEMEEIKARDPALAEQIKALSWKLKEKTNEAEALKEKLNVTEDRNKVETDSLKKALQTLRSDIESLKAELKSTREEKFSYQNKVVELRRALKSKLGELESKGLLRIEKQSSTNGPTIHLNIPDPEVTFDENFVNSLLQKSMDWTENRPLNNLQECLNSLKEEMVQLQKKIIENSESS